MDEASCNVEADVVEEGESAGVSMMSHSLLSGVEKR